MESHVVVVVCGLQLAGWEMIPRLVVKVRMRKVMI
jgi:hypothetical protein